MVVFEDALRILESCPEDCDRSCYRCLRSYRNKFEHDLLDRHLGASLLRFALTGAAPTLDAGRLARSTDLLFHDIERHGIDGLILSRNSSVAVQGLGKLVAPILAVNRRGAQFVICLHGPLTPGEPSDGSLRDLKEYSVALPVILVDELVVRRNLPRATADLISRIA